MTTAILLVFLFFFLLEYAVETALLALNLRHVARVGAEVPAPLAGRVSEETARRSRDYTLARGRFALLSGALGTSARLSFERGSESYGVDMVREETSRLILKESLRIEDNFSGSGGMTVEPVVDLTAVQAQGSVP